MFIQLIKIFLILFFVSDCNNFLHKFMDFLKHYTALLVKAILCEADYRILDLTFRTGFYQSRRLSNRLTTDSSDSNAETVILNV